MEQVTGRISQIIGPVVDVHFEIADKGLEINALPRIHDALCVTTPEGRSVIIEVHQHIGEDTVRCVAMDSTDGLKRGLEVSNTGKPIAMPAGAQIRGRVMNVTGRQIDGLGELSPRVPFLFIANLLSLRSLPPRRRCSSPASR